MSAKIPHVSIRLQKYFRATMASSAAAGMRGENVIGQVWADYLSESLIKAGTGLGLGAVFSLFLFKRRKWPLIMGTGIGLGIASGHCQASLDKTFCNKHLVKSAKS